MASATSVGTVEQLGLIGCGLMGGSFALALRRAGLARRVVGYSATESTRARALALGVIDAVASSPAEAARGSDLVLLAVPVAATASSFEAMRPALDGAALVMDVGSTKADVVQAARAQLGPALAQFVPAHPIAGKESSGVDQAEATLYDDRLCILTPLPENAPVLLQRAQALWQAAGCRVTRMTPDDHDAAFAAVSHLPHLLAYAYVNGMAAQAQGKDWLALAGPGFRDFSRIAASDPVMWRDILLANREQMLLQLARFRGALSDFESAVQRGDGAALHAMISAARSVRAGWHLGTQPHTPED